MSLHSQRLKYMRIEFFLAKCKKGRSDSMIGLDTALVGIEKRKSELEDAEEQRRLRANTEINTLATDKKCIL